MGTMTTLPATGGFTRADLDAMPDDGRRYELIDGVIVVTPPPVTRHQDIVASLLVLLKAAAPAELKVMVAPFAVALTGDRLIEPDLVVARRADVTERDLPGAPLLAIEVLSPSTRWIDLGRKRELLGEAGYPSYWVVDPGQERTPPTLVVHELDERRYVEIARVTGAESWTATRPFPVTIVPNDLLDE